MSTSGDYRRDLVKSMTMTQDEQTYCWALLGNIQTAEINGQSDILERELVKLRSYLTWIRSNTGQAWLKEQLADPED